MKRAILILCIILSCLTLNACNTRNVNNGIVSKEVISTQEEKFYYSKLYTYIGISKDELINKLGEGYEEVETGPEGSLMGLRYDNIDLVFAFDEGKVIIVYCGESVEFNGAKEGMNFEQIQERLGKSIIEKTWYEIPEHTAYAIKYVIDENVLTFLSFEEDGSESWLWVTKKDN